MILRIKPMLAGKHAEPCMLEIKGDLKDSEFYPVAVVHIDNFWQGRQGDNKVYNLLLSGNTVDIEISLTPLAPDGAKWCENCVLPPDDDGYCIRCGEPTRPAGKA